MIDLNSLNLYKEKISSYLDENALSISTKSNILNMFKFKSYTGNGIEPHGSVQIDENGIATGFRDGLIRSLTGCMRWIANPPDPVKEPATPCLRHP